MLKIQTSKIHPADLERLPLSANPYTECGFCEKNHVHASYGIWSPTYFSLQIDPACERVWKVVETPFRAEIEESSHGDLLQKIEATYAGRTAVRIACEMPVRDYLTTHGLEALSDIYCCYGIPAALDQIRIMNMRPMDPEK